MIILDFILLIFVRLYVGLLYLLPEKIGFYFAKGLIRFILIFLPRSTSVGLKNLELVFPEKTKKEHRKILKSSYDTLVWNLLGFAKIPLMTKSKSMEMIDYTEVTKLTTKIRNRELRAGEEIKTGFLVPTLHTGCFETFVQFHALNDKPNSFLARGFGLPLVDAYWNKRRENFGGKVFFRKGGYTEIIQRIKSGDDVALLFDQNVKANHAIFVDFFGIKAATTKTIGIVALRTACPIIFATTVYLGNGKHKIYAYEVKNPIDETGTIEEKVEKITKELHRHAEDVIRKHPDQWLWIHRRFKTRPKGEPENMY